MTEAIYSKQTIEQAAAANILRRGAHLSVAEQLKRIRSAIADCDRFIAKEGPRDPALRPAETQKTLDFTIQHRLNLLAAVAALEAQQASA
jgi:hypothetical protein